MKTTKEKFVEIDGRIKLVNQKIDLIRLALADLLLPFNPDRYFLGKSVALSFGTFLLFLFFDTSSPFTHWSFYHLS